MNAILNVCVTCRAGVSPADGIAPPGAQLFKELLGRGEIAGVSLNPVECLSACSQGCSIALSGQGRWTYVYGRLDLSHVDDIRTGAHAYAKAPDGIVPWRERPEVFRKQSIARIPPLPSPQEIKE